MGGSQRISVRLDIEKVRSKITFCFYLAALVFFNVQRFCSQFYLPSFLRIQTLHCHSDADDASLVAQPFELEIGTPSAYLQVSTVRKPDLPLAPIDSENHQVVVFHIFLYPRYSLRTKNKQRYPSDVLFKQDRYASPCCVRLNGCNLLILIKRQILLLESIPPFDARSPWYILQLVNNMDRPHSSDTTCSKREIDKLYVRMCRWGAS